MASECGRYMLMVVCSSACGPSHGPGVPINHTTPAGTSPNENGIGAIFIPSGAGYLQHGTVTLITSDWVLTAAHLVDRVGLSGQLRIAIGPRTANPQLPPGMPYPQASDLIAIDETMCFVHPLFRPGMTDSANCFFRPNNVALDMANPDYDLALIHLARPVSRTVALPFRVLLLAPEVNWEGQEVQWVGAGCYTQFCEAGVRREGLTDLNGLGATVGVQLQSNVLWSAPGLRTNGQRRAFLLPGDSGGPLLWTHRAAAPYPRKTLIGVASQGTVTVADPTRGGSYWTYTAGPRVAVWINEVMTFGALGRGMTTGSVSPSTRWLGEGAGDSDNCPAVFNPWQDDSDGDGIGDECDP